MPRLKNPMAKPVVINLLDNILTGYEVKLDVKDDDGSLVDTVTAHWLIPEENGSLRKSTVDVSIPSALAVVNAVFNATKNLVS